jgi:hypothetical protein
LIAMGSGLWPAHAGNLFACVGGVSSTSLSLEISIAHRFHDTNQGSGRNMNAA